MKKLIIVVLFFVGISVSAQAGSYGLYADRGTDNIIIIKPGADNDTILIVDTESLTVRSVCFNLQLMCADFGGRDICWGSGNLHRVVPGGLRYAGEVYFRNVPGYQVTDDYYMEQNITFTITRNDESIDLSLVQLRDTSEN